MSKLIDIKGLKFGKLTVIEKIGATRKEQANNRRPRSCYRIREL